MSEVEALIEALTLQVEVVRQLDDRDLVVESPCPGWNVATVLRHSLGVTQKFTAFASGRTDSPRTPHHELLTPDHLAASERVARDAELAWIATDLSRTCHLPFGDFSAEEAAGINLFDVLAHTWDVAEVTDIQLRCPDELWQVGEQAARAVLERGRDAAHYAPVVAVVTDSSPRQRFLAYVGRAGSR